MKVLKFGGTSIGSVERIKEVAKLIINNWRNTKLPTRQVVVLSAMAGTTNSLGEIVESLYNRSHQEANQLIDKLQVNYKNILNKLFDSESFRKEGNNLIEYHFEYIRSFTQDMFTIHEERAILAQGELISSALFQLYFQEKKINSVLLPALNFMRIDTNGEPDNFYIKENLKRELEKYPSENLFITQGYICRNLYGEIDNLKRGGSDYSASLIGEALNAEEIQIWTDISGFHNNDPRYVEKTYPIERLTFDEAAELAYFGAKILHPSSVLPAKVANIPVRLKNTMNAMDPGTIISGEPNVKGIKAVAAKDGITVIKIKSSRMLMAYGFLRKVFEVFERFKTPIDMITTSEVAVSVTIDNTKFLSEIVEELKFYGSVEIEQNQTIICVVGENLIEQKGIIDRVLEALKHFHIRMISYGGSKHSISILVNSSDKKEALISLNEIFST